MALFAYLFGIIKQKLNLWSAVAVGIILNGIIAPALFIPIPGFGVAFFIAMLIPLFVGSAVNIVLAAVLSKRFTEKEDINLSH